MSGIVVSLEPDDADADVAKLVTLRYNALVEMNALRVGTGLAPSRTLIAFAHEVKLVQGRTYDFLLRVAGAPVRKLPSKAQIALAGLVPLIKRSHMLRSRLEAVPISEIRSREKAAAVPPIRKSSGRATPALGERAEELEKVRGVVSRYWPRHWPVLEAELACCGTLLLENVTQGLALMIVGESGEGKGTTLDMFEGAERVLSMGKFTIASMMSGYAGEGVTKEHQEEISLTEMVKHKVLVTPDLGPLFRGGTAEARQSMYSEMPDFVDGRGIVRMTGTHGLMGKKGDYTFVWLGGTTPFHTETWAAMATVGPRLLFMRLRAAKPEDPYVSAAEYGPVKARCGEAVRRYLEWIFSRYETRTQAWPPMSAEVERKVLHYAELIALGQTYLAPRASASDDPVRPTPNHLYERLAILASGLAFVRGKVLVDEDELKTIRWIMASNAPKVRGPVIRALDEGHVSIPAIAEATRLRYPQVQATLEELRRLRIAQQVTIGKQGGVAGTWGFCPKPEDPWAGID